MIEKKVCIGLSMVKNEEDIIETFIRYNLQYLDHIFVIDNNSNDGTVDILNALIAEGLNLTLWKDDSLSYIQSEITTRAYHRISEIKDFDFFFSLDADELLVIDDSSFLLNSNKGDVYTIDMYDYITESEKISDDVISSMTRRFINKTISGKVFFHHDRENNNKYTIAQGNHGLLLNNKILSPSVCGIKIAHFPYRGKDHYLSKIIIGSQAMLLRDEFFLESEHAMGIHWRNEYINFKEKKGVITFDDYIKRAYYISDIEELMNITIKDEVKFTTNIKYSHKKKSTSLNYKLVMNFEKITKLYWMSEKKSLLSIIKERLNKKIKNKKVKYKNSIGKRFAFYKKTS
ncbi:glycosyltransferase family 2 protein [Pectobacterium brasiliense]|uniref:glycosyltransferase family 2 protein n=1 Tax=Pectobacterium brasiliense TaxID=180957 RepID=UPI001968D0B2|nr:glycosyltransferase family 2 protein [Pectobacterium brasiliense]MBN3116415.1 glycosyltransferase family 2 protein [Pectobacterium brasiliense]MBN3130871.1 glycosyltransferase family 2 protein [Pectobacterium brasiliense]